MDKIDIKDILNKTLQVFPNNEKDSITIKIHPSYTMSLIEVIVHRATGNVTADELRIMAEMGYTIRPHDGEMTFYYSEGQHTEAPVSLKGTLHPSQVKTMMSVGNLFFEDGVLRLQVDK